MAITYHSEETTFRYKGLKRRTSSWLKETILNEGAIAGDISVIFCSDPYLLTINKQYLDHNYYTDIITFDYCSCKNETRTVSGDLFISVDTVKGNATELGIPFETELKRVVLHGVLHLIGYGDKTTKEKVSMRQKEDFYLNRF